MEQTRSHFFAGPCRSGHQNTTASACDALQRGPHSIYDCRIAGELVDLRLVLAQPRILAAKPFRLRCSLYQVKQTFRFEWLLDEVDGAATDGTDGRVDIAVTGEDDDGQIGFTHLDGIENLEPIHLATVQPDV